MNTKTRVHYCDDREALTACNRFAVNEFWAKRYGTKKARAYTNDWLKVTCEACAKRPF